MYLKSHIGQRRIRHSELIAWRQAVAILRTIEIDHMVVLGYWGRGAWQCPVPRCVFARRHARSDRAWAEFHARPDPITAGRGADKALPYWTFCGTPTCLPCLEGLVPDHEDIYGGYVLETDTLPVCPECGCDLDMTYIGGEESR